MSKPIVVRLIKNKKTFEVLTNHGTVKLFREGKMSISKVTASDEVYKNSSKGDRYTHDELKSTFGTSNATDCITEILMKGELQLTTQDRKDKINEKYKQIVNYIHKYYINPKTNLPHPVVHIEAALQHVKFKVDINESVEKQVEIAMKMLIGTLICRKSVMEGTLTIPNWCIGNAYGIINGLCEINKEQYTQHGCEYYISIIPGNYDTLAKKLDSITKGEFEFEVNIDNTLSATTSTTSTTRSRKQNKKNKK